MDEYQRTGPLGKTSPQVRVRLQQIRRVLTFAGQVATAVREEFEVAALNAEDAVVAAIGRLDASLDGVARRVAEGERLAAAAEEMAEPQAIRALAGYELRLRELTAASRALEADAAALRRRLTGALDPEPAGGLAPPGAATPAAAAPGRGAGTGPRLGGSPAATALLRRPGARPAVVAQPGGPIAGPDALARARQAFEAVHKFVSGVLAYVGPRLKLVEVAVQVVGPPGKLVTWPEVQRAIPGAVMKAALPPPDRGWIAPLAQLFLRDQAAARRGRIALVQLGQAQERHGEALMLAASLAHEPPPRHQVLLGGFDTPRYAASVHPLKHLHVTFRGVPHLEKIFPTPAVQAAAAPRTFKA